MAVQGDQRSPSYTVPMVPCEAGVEPRHLTKRPGVLIVSDARMYRDGLRMHLESCEEIEVLGAVATEADAQASVALLAPDVVLCDMALPRGLDAARTIGAAHASVRVIVFAVPDNEVDVPACAEAGVAGFVTRDASVDDLTAALLGVARGEIVCSPKATAALFHRLALLSASRDASDASLALTRRENEIVRLIDRGMSNKDIARLLGIGLATAKNHVHHILEKLRVERRGNIAARVRELRRDP